MSCRDPWKRYGSAAVIAVSLLSLASVATASEIETVAARIAREAVVEHHCVHPPKDIRVSDIHVKFHGDFTYLFVKLRWYQERPRTHRVWYTSDVYISMVNRAHLRRIFDMSYEDDCRSWSSRCDRTPEVITRWNERFSRVDPFDSPRTIGQPFGRWNSCQVDWTEPPATLPPQFPEGFEEQQQWDEPPAILPGENFDNGQPLPPSEPVIPSESDIDPAFDLELLDQGGHGKASQSIERSSVPYPQGSFSDNGDLRATNAEDVTSIRLVPVNGPKSAVSTPCIETPQQDLRRVDPEFSDRSEEQPVWQLDGLKPVDYESPAEGSDDATFLKPADDRPVWQLDGLDRVGSQSSNLGTSRPFESANILAASPPWITSDLLVESARPDHVLTSNSAWSDFDELSHGTIVQTAYQPGSQSSQSPANESANPVQNPNSTQSPDSSAQTQQTPSAPPTPPQRPPTSSQNRVSNTRLARAPEMFGDLFITPSICLTTIANAEPFEGAGLFGEGSPSFGTASRISENNHTLPRDRVYYTYNYFEAALTATTAGLGGFFEPPGKKSLPVSRHTVGYEKTFLDGQASIEVRFPFYINGDFTRSLFEEDFSTDSSQLGNLTLIGKYLLVSGENGALGAGLSVDLPTSDDFVAHVNNAHLDMKNESIFISPFLAAILTPNDQWFIQGFAQLQFVPNGNPVDIQYEVDDDFIVLFNAGRYTPRSAAMVNAYVGRWLFLNPDRPIVTGLAAVAEFNSFVALQAADRIDSLPDAIPGYSVEGPTREYVTNLTLGLHALIGDRNTLRLGYVQPLHHRQFDFEFLLQWNLML